MKLPALLIVAALLAACATEKAGLRRGAESRVELCLSSTRCQRAATVACYKDTEAWCLEHHMERLCGEGGAPGVCKP